ncbi:MAG: A24 family peptidase C-terminal domain-containing protein [Candidatus Bathyarchaeales archaeon]
MQLISLINVTKLLVSVGFLTYASWSDFKTREVSNKVWVLLAPPAFTLTAIELFLYGSLQQLLLYGLCFGLTATFATVLFYSGGFGGADSKALMCLALALPFYPEIFQPLTGTPSPISKFFFPITVFSNAVLLAAATAIYLLFYNIVWHWKNGRKLFEGYETSFGKKIMVLLTGYKVSISKLKDKWHIYPMEDLEENTLKRTLLVMPKDEGRDAIVQRLAKAVEEGKIDNSVWATPGLPMLIFITAGLILALMLDNVIWVCIRLLIG